VLVVRRRFAGGSRNEWDPAEVENHRALKVQIVKFR
jgi:hypothetical protein